MPIRTPRVKKERSCSGNAGESHDDRGTSRAHDTQEAYDTTHCQEVESNDTTDTSWHKSDYDSDPESEHQVEGLTNDAHDNNKDMRSRNTLEEELLRGEIKEEQDGEQVDDEDEDERVTEIITTTTTTTTQPSSATSIPTPFTTEEMVGLAEILSSCPPPRGSNRGPRYTWAKARWEHWSLVDRVFYLAASQY